MNNYIRVGDFIYKRSDYYEFDNLSIGEVLSRWAEDGDKPRSWDSIQVNYPLKDVWRYREYTWTREDARLSPAEWDELKASMRTGWEKDNPLIIQFGRNGVAKVGEGNHRLAIARDLGWKTIPVRFGSFDQEVTLTEIEEEEIPTKPEPPRKPGTPEEEKELQQQTDEIMDLF